MNAIDWKNPPTNHDELPIWKVFVSSQPERVWEVVHRWLKRCGNPYVVPVWEEDEVKQKRLIFQAALQYVIK